MSGEALAATLGVSRVAVSKHVAALRSAGYVIESHPGSGYRFVGSPKLAVPGELAPLLRDPLWARVEGGMETASTNDDARRLAREGAPEGTVVVAAMQTAGKGRLGRLWDSPPGGAYVSAILRPQAAPLEVAPLGLVVAIGIARGLRALGANPLLKWPNDVWLDNGKLAGVLVETATEGESVSWVVAGFGLNVVAPAAPAPGASYLDATVGAITPASAAAAALDGVASAYRDWRSAGFAELAHEFDRHSMLLGGDVAVRDVTGAVLVTGRVACVDGDGRLVVDSSDGRVAIAAGDVTLRRSAT